MLKLYGTYLNWKPFKYRLTPYGLRGEGLNLELPNFNLQFKNNSFTYSLTNLWNSLPSQMRVLSDANGSTQEVNCTITAF